jgi:hypothetical protein
MRSSHGWSADPRLETYVTGVVGAFGKDSRVLGWDVWNEPDNMNTNSYGSQEPKNKVDLVLKLLPQVFAWAREAGADQPLERRSKDFRAVHQSR